MEGLAMAPDYPEVNALKRCIDDGRVELSVLPEHFPRSHRQVLVCRGDQTHVVPFCDEFSDCEQPNRVVWLHLVLDACELVQECEDVDEWTIDSEAPTEHAAEWYAHLMAVASEIQDWVGPDVQPISSWDFQMNTGVTKALRACDRGGTLPDDGLAEPSHD